MVVMSRSVGESIVVGEITIVVLKIGSDHVRLGIESPRDAPVASRHPPIPMSTIDERTTSGTPTGNDPDGRQYNNGRRRIA